MNDELRDRLQFILREEIAPELEFDGGEIEVVKVEDGIASVRLGSLCSSCPATLTLIVMQLEAELRERMPEIEILEAVV